MEEGTKNVPVRYVRHCPRGFIIQLNSGLCASRWQAFWDEGGIPIPIPIWMNGVRLSKQLQ
jgi:hypothetical protein